MRTTCIGCEHYEPVSDGYGLCMKEAIGVMVIDDYEPTKNHLYCQKDVIENDRHGPMSYQKETKTAYQMQREDWCDGCVEDVNKCIKQNECEGYRRYNEDTN